jgi:hypothetical protein
VFSTNIFISFEGQLPGVRACWCPTTLINNPDMHLQRRLEAQKANTVSLMNRAKAMVEAYRSDTPSVGAPIVAEPPALASLVPVQPTSAAPSAPSEEAVATVTHSSHEMHGETQVRESVVLQYESNDAPLDPQGYPASADRHAAALSRAENAKVPDGSPRTASCNTHTLCLPHRPVPCRFWTHVDPKRRSRALHECSQVHRTRGLS